MHSTRVEFALVLPELALLYPDTDATLRFLVSSISLVVLIVPGEPFPAVALFAALGLVQGASFADIP